MQVGERVVIRSADPCNGRAGSVVRISNTPGLGDVTAHVALDWQPGDGPQNIVYSATLAQVEKEYMASQKLDRDAKIASWDADVPVMLEGIEQGYLDKHIRQIAKACIDRYQKIKGSELVAVAQSSQVKTGSIKHPVSSGSPQDGVGQIVAPTTMITVASVRHKGSAWATINETDARKVIRNDGLILHIDRRDFLGKTIRIQPQSLKERAYDGLRIRIDACGPKMIKVAFVDAPPVGSGYANKIKADAPCFMSYKVLVPYLDII